MDAVRPEVSAAIDRFLAEPDGESFLRLERDVLASFQLAASHVVAAVLVFLHGEGGWAQAAVNVARDMAPCRLRHRGRRTTPVRFLGGARLTVATPYLSEDRRPHRGRRRGVGRRGATGSGCYPVLEALGIWNRATPALLGEVACHAVRSASFAEARQALAERGIALDKKTVRTLALHVGEEALRHRHARIEAAAQRSARLGEFSGRRLVLSADGGRMRMREGGQSGPKGRKGHRRYRTPWREPKLVTSYVIDAHGRRDGSVPIWYDGTLGNADKAFEILTAELRLRGAAFAQEVIVIADGAPWIWNRIDDLARAVELGPEKIVRVADFYHAVEHLTAVAELRRGWNDTKKKRWVKRMRKQLKRGRIDAVIEAIRSLCRGKNAGPIATELAYFENRRELMRYDVFRKRGIPLGSGAIESAIRRIVNLRMKGPSIFWRAENAERLLHLRCYLKAGRWDELMRRVLYRSHLGRRRPEDLQRVA